jgi:5-methylcytosine-specific restriction protein A
MMNKPRRIKPPGLFLWEKPEVKDMPYKPKVPCRHPGCPNLVPAGQKYCEEHKALHPEEIRSAARRGYNSRWQKESKKFLQLHPLCEECLKGGKATPATVVDHIVPHRGDAKLFWDQSNWQALCKEL